MIVVADTSPLNYLILIGHTDVLPLLYGEVIIPPAVQDEMLDVLAPASVRSWMSNPPPWLEIRTPGSLPFLLNPVLGAGEREAIALAHAAPSGTILLVDDRAARDEAERLGLKVAGTLAILRQASNQGFLDFPSTVERLLQTNFKASDSLLRKFLK